MPIRGYGVLKAQVVGWQASSPHFQIHVRAAQVDYRIAVNVQSQEAPSQVDYLSNPNYQPTHAADLLALPDGFRTLPSQPGGLALDFVRGNLFDPRQMVPLPAHKPGPENDLDDFVQDQTKQAQADPQARVYAFGQRWGPEPGRPDQAFHFQPGNGVHDIHMNQGNDAKFAGDNGIYQDGALFFSFPQANRWVAIFLAFQSQTWCTDQHGNAIQPCDAGPRR
jgi:uncharacterized protein YukJ